MTAAVSERLSSHSQKGIFLERKDNSTLLVHIRGKWQLGRDMPSASVVAQELSGRSARSRIGFGTSKLTGWDSALISFLVGVDELCRLHTVENDRSGLPAGVRRLVELAEAVPEK
jgi:phospholipid/cholesterol/gamma-HCH transport system permease protein